MAWGGFCGGFAGATTTAAEGGGGNVKKKPAALVASMASAAAAANGGMDALHLAVREQRFRNRMKSAMTAAALAKTAARKPIDVANARAAAASAAADEHLERAHLAEAAAAAAVAEAASLRAAVAALESRAAAVEHREATNQHRLKVFERMEPIFERVAEWQRFAGPEEVMERMDTLETQCVDLSTQLADAHEALAEARRRADAVEARETSTKYREREDGLQKVAAQATHAAVHRAVREELASAKAHLSTMRDRDAAYLTLRRGVHDLWTQVISKSDLVVGVVVQVEFRFTHDLKGAWFPNS